MKIYPFFKTTLLSLGAKKTVGARALVVDQDKVLLIEHTYMPEWYTIGGGVDKGETPKEAILRELREEVGVEAHSLKLFNVYHKPAGKRDDYVVLYICDQFVEQNTRCALEIKEKKWFKFNELPNAISPATLRRIHEYQGKRDGSERW